MAILTSGGVFFVEDNKQNGCAESPIGRTAKDFFLGCVALVPLAVFAAAFYYLVIFFEFLGAMLFGLTKSVWTSAAVSLFIVLILVYTGRKLRRREKWLLNIVELGISKIPVVGGWYSTFRDMVQTFTASGGERGYLGTAKVPCGDGYIIGFVTKKEVDSNGASHVTIFVPTSPNPTTGLVFFFPESSVEYLEMTPERAFSKIISLGMK